MKFLSEDLLERVPLKVHCTPLLESLLLTQDQSGAFESLDTDGLAPALERSVSLLLESLDDFSLQQREVQMFERHSRNKSLKEAGKGMRVIFSNLH